MYAEATALGEVRGYSTCPQTPIIPQLDLQFEDGVLLLQQIIYNLHKPYVTHTPFIKGDILNAWHQYADLSCQTSSYMYIETNFGEGERPIFVG